MDEIANEVGVKPNVIKLFKQDFLLGMKVCICLLLFETTRIDRFFKVFHAVGITRNVSQLEGFETSKYRIFLRFLYIAIVIWTKTRHEGAERHLNANAEADVVKHIDYAKCSTHFRKRINLLLLNTGFVRSLHSIPISPNGTWELVWSAGDHYDARWEDIVSTYYSESWCWCKQYGIVSRFIFLVLICRLFALLICVAHTVNHHRTLFHNVPFCQSWMLRHAQLRT